MEIADILVINKADRPHVENTEHALRSTLELAHPTKRVFRHHGQTITTGDSSHGSPNTPPGNDIQSLWIPPIKKTVATEGKGIAELAESFQSMWHTYVKVEIGPLGPPRLGSELEAVDSRSVDGTLYGHHPTKEVQ